MNRRRKNNIVIGTLCAVLILMGVGYAILSTTLNIGGTANIKGDFDIHFTRIERSSSTISDSTLLSTMDNGTGITGGTNNHEGTFTAVLQKPTDYVIYDVVVANTGSIDGYLTFTFGDTNSNFNYYKDFYSVEFIRDDVTPNIKADILQNGTFTDSEVLVNTTGTRTYKIKVTFKESATSFPDVTTNGDFECSLNLTYSQQVPGGNSGASDQSGLTTYTGTYSNPDDSTYDGQTLLITLQDEQNGTKSIVQFMVGEEDVAPMLQQEGVVFEPYDSNMTITKNYLGITPTTGDYVLGLEGELVAILHDGIIYLQMESKADEPVQQLTIGGSSSGNNGSSSSEPISQSVAGTYTGEYVGINISMTLDQNMNVTEYIMGGQNALTENGHFEAYDSNIDYSQYEGYSDYSPVINPNDYILIAVPTGGSNEQISAVFRNNEIFILIQPGAGTISLTKQQ